MNVRKQVVTSRHFSSRDGLLALNSGPAELGRLLSHSSGTIIYWSQHRGLPRTAEGLYNVKTALLWLENYYRGKRPPVRVDALTQEQLSVFLAQSRQWIIARTQRDRLPRRGDGLYDLRAVCAWLPSYYRKTYERDYQCRLLTMRTKLTRNVRQLERFLAAGENGKTDKQTLFLKGIFSWRVSN